MRSPSSPGMSLSDVAEWVFNTAHHPASTWAMGLLPTEILLTQATLASLSPGRIPKTLYFVSRGRFHAVKVKDGMYAHGFATLFVDSPKKSAAISLYPDGFGVRLAFRYAAAYDGALVETACVVGGPDAENVLTQAEFVVFLGF